MFDLEDYLNGILADELMPPELRTKAAFELGTLNGYRVTQTYHLVWKFSSASRLALKRYRIFAKGTVHKEAVEDAQTDEATVTMKHYDLDFVAWLADLGFHQYVSPEGIHGGKQPPYTQAERVRKMLEAFERKLVPNLLTESEEDKERRFNATENREHFMWRAYGKV